MVPTTAAGASVAPPPQRTIAWILACLCCLALGSIASLSTQHYMPHLASSLHVFANNPNKQLQLLRSEPFERGNINATARVAALSTTSASSADATRNDTRYDRGVVLSLHNGVVSMGVSLIRELRCLGNNELIQVYHCFPDELSAAAQALLTRNDANVEIIDVCAELLNRSGIGDDIDDVFFGDAALAKSFQSYWLKPLALYHTKLQEVVLLDADAMLMRDPAELRAMSGYVRTGTTFFYDRVYKMDKFLTREDESGVPLLQRLIADFDYAQFGLAGPAPSQQLLDSFAYRQLTAHEMDSSMVLIDKARTGPVVLAVLKHLITRVRFEHAFSWGDKEAFWLAFELAHRAFFFSPFGLSLLDSVPNDDLVAHPESLCGSMAHFVPTETPAADAPELLYVNGKALLEPFPLGLDKSLRAKRSRMFNVNPTHVTPRYERRTFDAQRSASFECMDNMGAVPLPTYFYARLLRRRTHFFAAETRFLDGLDSCEL